MKKIHWLVATSITLALALGIFDHNSAQAAGPAAIDLGSASNFVILSKTGISTTGTTTITGNIGVSPIAASALTGFALTMHRSNTYSTSPRITGKVYAADYSAPTPATMTAAISDMETAYTAAADRTNQTATELGAGNIGGMTMAPGLYTWSTNLLIPTDITLAGGTNDVWVFQVDQQLTLSSAVHVNLTGGAKAGNVFWRVAGKTTLGSGSVFNGNILDKTAIVFETGATLNGRALAQTGVTLDANTVTLAAATTAVPTPAATNTNTVVTNTNTTVANTNTASTTTAGAAVTTTPGLPNTGTPQNGSALTWKVLLGLMVASGVGILLVRKQSSIQR